MAKKTKEKETGPKFQNINACLSSEVWENTNLVYRASSAKVKS